MPTPFEDPSSKETPTRETVLLDLPHYAGTHEPLAAAARRLMTYGATRVRILDHRCSITGGTWLTAAVLHPNLPPIGRSTSEHWADGRFSLHAQVLCEQLHALTHLLASTPKETDP